MRLPNLSPIAWTATGLAVLMATTRFHHEGTAFSLPDASLAVFFLAGWYLKNRLVFPGLLLLAFVIDYAAVTYGGVSGYCFSSAYAFLIPTYGAMWWAGCCGNKSGGRNTNSLGYALGALIAATAVAFVISNGSFLLFSGKVSGVSIADYASGIVGDFPGYIASTLAYCGFVFALEHMGRFFVIPSWQAKLK